ncbi:MAG: hypothetical protein R8K54_06845 [Mariprofundaceae bacterium]
MERAEDYRWSSASAIHHLLNLVWVGGAEADLDRVDNWTELLTSADQAAFDDLQMHERTGRPLGQESFVDQMSLISGRSLARKKLGPKR